MLSITKIPFRPIRNENLKEILNNINLDGVLDLRIRVRFLNMNDASLDRVSSYLMTCGSLMEKNRQNIASVILK